MKKLTELYEVAYRDVYSPNPNGGLPIKEESQPYKRPVPVKVASQMIRVTHQLVDFVIVTILLAIVSIIFPVIEQEPNATIAVYTIIFLYYIVFESQVGQTPGKMLTKSVVVDEYGNKVSIPYALLRTFVRLIPLGWFSFLGNPRGWHDKASNTYVMRKKDLAELKAKLNETVEQDHIINSLVTE